jgi:hypothetical protein
LPDEVTETFKERLRYLEEFREMLSTACSQPTPQGKCDALLKIEHDLGDLKVVPRSVLIELMSSLRDAEAFEDLIALYNAFPDSLKDYVVAKQQFALALNRRNQPGDREKALGILTDLLKTAARIRRRLESRGASTKTYIRRLPRLKKLQRSLR